jgi:hypothetical protein
VSPDAARLDEATRVLVQLSAAIAASDESTIRRWMARAAVTASQEHVEEVVLQSYLFCGFPRALNAAREYRGVLPRAVVVETRRPFACLAQRPLAALRERLVRSAREVALLHADRREHRLRDRDVLRLAAVRGASERELIVAPCERVEAPALDQRHDLEGLGAGAPVRDELRVARRGDERAGCVDDGRVHAMARLHECAARDDDVERELIHAGEPGE